VNVSTNLAASAFTVTGPATYTGSGTSFSQANAPAGEYNIAYSTVAGYTTPAPQSQFLPVGGSITFTGTYLGGIINVSTNLPAATFTITGPATYTGGGTSFSQGYASPGQYTIVFGAVAGYITPASQSLSLVDGGSITFTGTYRVLDAYQVGDPANLLMGDSYVNITNAGTRNGFDPAGGICVNVYAFDPSEEMVACCACYVSPDGLRSLSARQDLVSNTLTPGVPGSVTIKLLASTPVTGTTCDPSSPSFATLEQGMRAWGTDLHMNTTTGRYRITETVFLQADLSPSELTKLTTYCGFIEANGSTFGICRSCRFGGLGGARQ